MRAWKTDRSRRPVRYANQLPDQIERTTVATKKDKPHWGARKIRELLVRKLAGDVRIPAQNTVHPVLDRHGLVKRARQRRRFKAEGTPLSVASCPNDLWGADFKGEFKHAIDSQIGAVLPDDSVGALLFRNTNGPARLWDSHKGGTVRLPQVFNSRFSSSRKRKSVPLAMIRCGLDLIMPVSCMRSA